MNSAREEAAAFIVAHRLGRKPLPPLATGIRPADIDAGYALQALANAQLTHSGLGQVVGHKVGATNAAVQRHLRVAHAVGGAVFASTVHRGDAHVPHAGFVRPGVECELVVLIGSDLPPRAAPYGRAEIEAAIAACATGIELIDDRYVDVQALDTPTLIADNGLDAGVVIGTPITAWQALDLPTCAASIAVNGDIVARGSGANVMGDPINVALWFANDRARRGLGLRAGEFIFTGSMTDIVWVRPGDQVEVAIAGLGALRCTFTR